MPDRDPLTGVPASRHPFQFFALAACAISGFSTVFDLGQPQTLTALMPSFMVILWGWTLMMGSGLGIIASWWRDRITGLLLERIALGALGSSTAIYGLVLMSQSGKPGFVASMLCLSISVASFWRIIHVNRELKTLKKWIRTRMS